MTIESCLGAFAGISAGITLALPLCSPMSAESDRDVSPKLRCPTCGATEAATLIRSRAVAFVRCEACGGAWSGADRRRRYPSGQSTSALSRDQPPRPSTDGHSPAVLWRVGAFACELRTVTDMEFPAIVAELKNGDVVLE